MNSLTRTELVLEELEKTNQKFLSEIQGMSPDQAYEHWKAKKNIYQYNTKETKDAFAKMTQKRCSFCTRRIADYTAAMTVEHIETKRDCPKKIFQWDNLLCSCSTCNIKRSTKKYVKDMYLDPAKTKNIERYFCFEPDGTITPDESLTDAETEQANYMIGMYRLDRDDLNIERRAFFTSLLDDEYYNILAKKDKASQDIIFLSVFTYYKKGQENGKK